MTTYTIGLSSRIHIQRSSIFPWYHIKNKKMYIIDIMYIIALNMPANIENSAKATGLEKVSLHSSP